MQKLSTPLPKTAPERKASHSAPHSGQTTRRFPNSRPPVSASCSLRFPWPTPPSRSRPHSSAKTSPPTSGVPCAFPLRASSHKVLVSALRHLSSVFSALSPRKNAEKTDRKSTRLNSSHGYISY